MESFLTTPPEVLKLASHPIRWSVLRYLARSDYRVQELVTFLQLPQNLVSYHLRQLRAGNLVTERKSSADERSVYYSLDLEHFHLLYFQAVAQLHPALTEVPLDLGDGRQLAKVAHPPLRVLCLCTENSARSQMAEALLRHLSQGMVYACSAGSHPAKQVHPLAIRLIEHIGSDISQVRPKHFDEFRGQCFDVILTVCDQIREVCPTFSDNPVCIHWSFPDPAKCEGSEEERYHAFEQVATKLATRLHFLITRFEYESQRSNAGVV